MKIGGQVELDDSLQGEAAIRKVRVSPQPLDAVMLKLESWHATQRNHVMTCVYTQALAAKLKVDASTIVLSSFAGAARRGVQKIVFEVYGEPSKIASLSEDLKTMEGVVVQGDVGSASGEDIRKGEVWEEENGVFMLRKCPPGFLLVNTTIELQECSACPPETYIVDGSRACVDCPGLFRVYLPSLSLSLPLCVCFSLSLCLSLSVSVCLSLSLSLSLSRPG